jgi:hypothetical protein
MRDCDLMFVCADGLDVPIHRDAYVRVSHERLRCRHIRALTFDQGSERGTQRTPTDSFGDARTLCRRPDVIFHPRRWWLTAVHIRTGEDVVRVLIVRTPPALVAQHVSKSLQAYGWPRFSSAPHADARFHG